jgi:hypothetical protein
MRSTPARVNLTLYFDGRQVFSEQVTPRYRKTRPNGSSCPPTCRQATVEFELEELE